MKVFIPIFVFIGFIGLELKGVMSGELINGCALDVLVGLMSPLSFTFIIIIPIILLNRHITERDFQYQSVIRHRSWLSILWEQMIKVVIVSVLMAVFFITTVLLFSYMKRLPLYNWNSLHSIFFIRTGQRLGLDGFTVYLYAFVCIVIRIMIIQNILLLFQWGCQYPIIGIISILCISFDESIRGDRFICRLISFDYHIWISQFDRIRLLLQVSVYFCIGILLYQYFLSRKELLHCG